MTDQKIQLVDPNQPDPADIERAGKIIAAGGVVIFPAKCLYGVAADACDPMAVEKVFTLKRRPLNNPILVLVPGRDHLSALVKSIPEAAVCLMDAFWPGNLTLVFDAQDHLPAVLTAGTGKIGIRVPIHPVARALVRYLDHPVTGTSANLSGQAGCSSAAQLDPSLLQMADMVLDAGPLKGGKGSSIVDVTGPVPRILREGEVLEHQIKTALARQNHR